MSLGDILLRVGSITSRYEKYMPLEKELGKVGIEKGNDYEAAFRKFEYEVDRLEEKARGAKEERNRSTVAVLNNEIRKAKNLLLKEIPELTKLASKWSKGLSPEEKQEAEDRIQAIEERLQSVGDGFSMRRTGSSLPRKDIHLSGSFEGINSRIIQMLNMTDAESLFSHVLSTIPSESLDSNPVYTESTEESRAFRQEFEMAKLRQDEALDEISVGLTTLKSVANDMNEEMKVQDGLIDEIENKVDDANLELKSQNTKLKDLVHNVSRLRSIIDENK